MNEKELEQKFAAYRNEMGRCGRAPIPAAKRSLAPTLLAWGACAAVSVAILGVSLWPKPASARSLKKVNEAIQNAKSMRMEYSASVDGRPFRTYYAVAYRDGMWRYDVHKSPKFEWTYLVKGGMALMDYHSLPSATIYRRNPGNKFDALPGGNTGLDFAKESTDFGSTDMKRLVQIRRLHEAVDGVPTYLITLDRPVDHYHVEILVDQRTDLPIRVDGVVVNEAMKGPEGHPEVARPAETDHFRQVYHFNEPIPDSEFSFELKKPVIRLEAAQETLLKQWDRPVASGSEAQIRAASITPQGTIWIASSSQSASTLPTELVDENGTRYIRGSDQTPYSTDGVSEIKVQGEAISTVFFVPEKVGGPGPSQVSVSFARRDKDWALMGATSSGQGKLVGRPVSVKLTREGSERPSWFTALNLDRAGLENEINAWAARALAAEKKNLLEAARDYEECAVADRNFVPYVGYRWLLQAERCYRKAGILEEADRTHREAIALRETK